MQRIKFEPRIYQVRGMEFIDKVPRCLLFMEMGLGKTVTTLTALKKLFQTFEITKVLVIAPLTVAKTVWAQEVEKWAHLEGLRTSAIIGDVKDRKRAMQVQADIYIINRELVPWLVGILGGEWPYDCVVVDEVSSFKNHKSKRSKALSTVMPFTTRFIGLTGTPTPNGLQDLWQPMYYVDRGARLGKNITQFRSSYLQVTNSVGYVATKYAVSPESEQAIHNRIQDVVVSMKAEDYQKLPERINNRLEIDMPADLRRMYKEFEREKVLEIFTDINGEPKRINAGNAAALSNKLLQFCSGAVYDEDRGVHEIHDLKLDRLEEALDVHTGAGIVLFYSFQHEKDRIMQRIKPYGPRHMTAKTAIRDVADFNAGKIPILVTHPGSAGHGLNLDVGGDTVYWFSHQWSLELRQQGDARVVRPATGRMRPIFYHDFVLKGTYDVKVLNVQREKGATQSRVMDAVKLLVNEYFYGKSV